MVPLFSLIFMKHQPSHEPVLLHSTYNLSSLYFFQRSTVQELCLFVSRQVIKQSKRGELKSFKHQNYICNVRVSKSGLAVAVVCEEKYPTNVSFEMLKEAMELFVKKVDEETWKSTTKDANFPVEGIEELLKRYETKTGTKIELIQRELDETKKILHEDINLLITRSESIDSILDKSNDLSQASKVFVKQAQDLNGPCPKCTIL